MIEGDWSGRVTGLRDQRVEIAMMRTPDGHGRIELSRFLAPPVVADHRNAPVNALGYLRVMFAVDDLDDILARLRATRRAARRRGGPVRRRVSALLRPWAPRAFSSGWPSKSRRSGRDVVSPTEPGLDALRHRGSGFGPVAVTRRCGTQSSTWAKPSKRPSASSTHVEEGAPVELHVGEVLEEDVDQGRRRRSGTAVRSARPDGRARTRRTRHRRRRRGARGPSGRHAGARAG